MQVIIAGAGGAAHLPGMVAAHTLLPVLGVPVESHALQGHRFAAVDRADARRHSGRHAGHRQGRGDQRGPAGRGILALIGSRAAREAASSFASEQTERVRGETLP